MCAPGGLTARELEVVRLITLGLSDRQIAARLGVSIRTAEYHVEQIRAKLGYTSRTQVVVWAVARGITFAAR